MFSPKGMELERGWPGRVDGNRISQFAAQTLQAFFTGGGGARVHAEFELEACDLRPPVLQPPSVRLFAPRESPGRPFFSFVSPYPVLGHEQELVYPRGTDELVFRRATAAVIGASGMIGGFTAANLWTARDLARAEREAGFGPSKSCDFALSLGPLLVTPEEFQGGLPRVLVNGEERSSPEPIAFAQPWEALVSHAAVNTSLRAGDLLLLADEPDARAPLMPGDVVELELDAIGALRTRVRDAHPAAVD